MALYKKVTILLLCIFCVGAFAGERPFKPPFHIKWVAKLKKEKAVSRRPFQFSAPVIESGVIYIGSAGGKVYAFSEAKGKRLWATKVEGGVFAEAVTDGDLLYVADIKGNVYSISKADGKIKWKIELGAEISARPLVVEDTVYVATTQRQLMALDKESGGRKWYTLKEGLLPNMTIKGSSNPVFYEGKIFLGFADGIFAAYNPLNGDVLWKAQVADHAERFQDIDSTPLIINGVIYISTSAGETFAVNAKDGAVIWRISKGSVNDPITDGEKIYIAGSGVLSAVSKENGQILWEQDFEEPEISTPAIKDNVIVTASTKDKLYAVSAVTGELKYKRYLGKGSFGKPVISGSTLYILTNNSRLFALKGSK